MSDEHLAPDTHMFFLTLSLYNINAQKYEAVTEEKERSHEQQGG